MNSQTDLQYQADILPGVSRTFALTIPVLPGELADVVTNAYLLCRLADTIEDDVGLTDAQKTEFHARFVRVVEGAEPAEPFATELAPLLSERTLAEERDLVRNTARVIRVAHGFSSAERDALTRCVRIMCRGMPEFQRNRSIAGLAALRNLDEYCYYVAGVVGEMLTELFLLHCPELEAKRDRMMRLAVSFGQGLQMTNILKDIWDDQQAETCWLPRSVFERHGFDLNAMESAHESRAFAAGLDELIGVAHAHLRNALEYSCLIPRRESGIRKFCLWAIGLAVLTLRKIHNNPGFTSGADVKVSRRTVKATILTTNIALKSNRALKLVFDRAADGLPLASSDLSLARPSYGPASEVS
ncbi:MAG: squalene/phytoene synthase family protein [Gammaproteobacteria bacterium]|nr:squalene/phytoene synthase family protein [Gammaproteobacteria bacterium]